MGESDEGIALIGSADASIGNVGEEWYDSPGRNQRPRQPVLLHFVAEDTRCNSSNLLVLASAMPHEMRGGIHHLANRQLTCLIYRQLCEDAQCALLRRLFIIVSKQFYYIWDAKLQDSGSTVGQRDQLRERHHLQSTCISTRALTVPNHLYLYMRGKASGREGRNTVQGAVADVLRRISTRCLRLRAVHTV